MKKIFLQFLLLLCLSVFFASCNALPEKTTLTPDDNSFDNYNVSSIDDISGDKDDFTVKIDVPLFSEPISVLSPAAKVYFDSDFDVILQDAISGHTENDKDKAEGVLLSYGVNKLPDGISIKRATVQIFEKGEKTPWKSVTFEKDSFDCIIYNCKTDTEYNFTINVTFSNAFTVSEYGSFKTAKSMRMMRVDGIHNVRDIGGYETIDGKTIKQGLLYRGTELDAAIESTFKLTPAGIREMTNVLGIKFDMDLRAPQANGKNVLNVIQKYYDAKHYDSIFYEPGKTNNKAVFTDMANSANYPMYVHCTYGKDRTGTVCFILEALLGMSEEDIIRDFEISGLTDRISGHNRNDYFMQTLSNFKTLNGGETLQENAENYLLSIGITPEQIQNIKDIFIEK